MFNFLVHRQVLFMMPVFLCGFWIGRVGLLESWPAASYSERGVADKPQNAVAGSGASSLGKAHTDESAGNCVAELQRKTFERTDMHDAGQQSPAPSTLAAAATHVLWQAPVQTVDGDIVISLEAAGVPQTEAQSPTENILGLIVDAN
ncbi:hypothetical protein [Methylomonas rosea]|uniref:Uncharacterized protein n=1 Tax=Methylomonas rosea TaxID=2952227 RepID=A0ABT1TRB4_9GAMM|nr:hypothetical protein [Methylomonas sp. WSC-7]MCQ8117306.1 hypothetical protein [Methylomonas sp. WSC-7]